MKIYYCFSIDFSWGCIVKGRLGNREFLLLLQGVTPRRGDSVKELRDETMDLWRWLRRLKMNYLRGM
jgi:hypothetical protein